MTDTEKPMLLLDASGPESYVGIIRNAAWNILLHTEEPALESLFANVKTAFDQTKLTLHDIGGFIYCDGPGSMLGLRLSSLAIRSWLAIPDFSNLSSIVYHRLHMAAAGLQLPKDSLLITEFKEKKWHVLRVSETLSHETEIQTFDYDTIKDSGVPIYYLRQRKSWQSLDFEHTPVSYDLKMLPLILSEKKELFTPTDIPVPLVREAAEYQTWIPARHA